MGDGTNALGACVNGRVQRLGLLGFYAAALIGAGWFLADRLGRAGAERESERLAAVDAVQTQLSLSMIAAQSYVELLQRTVQNEMAVRPPAAPASILLQALKADSQGVFALDELPPSIGRDEIGNLTGFGGLAGRDDYFRTAFLARYTPEYFAGLVAEPTHRLWIARDDAQAIGYAHAGPCELPHPGVTPACGELKRLYVRRGWQGGGLGRMLLATALTWLSAPGRTLWIGVFADNPGAQRLYAGEGFEKVGEYAFIVGGTRDREFILRRR